MAWTSFAVGLELPLRATPAAVRAFDHGAAHVADAVLSSAPADVTAATCKAAPGMVLFTATVGFS